MSAALDLPPGGIAWDETLELEASDGVRLRGALWRCGGAGGRGLVLLLNGRTEFLEKCAIPAAELTRRGFDAVSVDWRGQGFSERLVRPHLKGHVSAFAEYRLDLAALMAHPAVAEIADRPVMLAHSMGATIGLGALLRGELTVRAAILSAPMLGIAMNRFTRAAGSLVLWTARLLGKLEGWPPFGRMDQPYAFTDFEDNVLTSDRAVFDWLAQAIRRAPELQLAMPTLGWMGAAKAEMAWLAGQGRLRCPGLCLVGTEEAVVDVAAMRSGAERLGAELVEIAGARHELLVEAEPMRGQGWAAIDRFLAENGI